MQVGQVVANATLLPPPFGAAKGRAGEGLLLLPAPRFCSCHATHGNAAGYPPSCSTSHNRNRFIASRSSRERSRVNQ